MINYGELVIGGKWEKTIRLIKPNSQAWPVGAVDWTWVLRLAFASTRWELEVSPTARVELMRTNAENDTVRLLFEIDGDDTVDFSVGTHFIDIQSDAPTEVSGVSDRRYYPNAHGEVAVRQPEGYGS